jgi:hypothetical protein
MELIYFTSDPTRQRTGIAAEWVESFATFYNDMKAKANAPKAWNHYTWAYFNMFKNTLKENNCTAKEHASAMAICEKNIRNWHTERKAADPPRRFLGMRQNDK